LKTLPGYEMCLGACSEGECCWKKDKSCADNPQCTGYDACTNLIGSTITATAEEKIPEAPDYLAPACSDDSLNTVSGYELCQEACIKVTWVDAGSSPLCVCSV